MLFSLLNHTDTTSSPSRMQRAATYVRLILTGSVLLLGFAGAGIVSAEQSMLDICHVSGQGEFHLISIAAAAHAAHIAHGDKAPEHFSRDADGDGFGSMSEFVAACDVPEGYVENDTDCDDANTDVYPGAEEVEGALVRLRRTGRTR